MPERLQTGNRSGKFASLSMKIMELILVSRGCFENVLRIFEVFEANLFHSCSTSTLEFFLTTERVESLICE